MWSDSLLIAPVVESDRSGQAATRLPGPVATRLSVAPMMDRTDRHFRYLIRLLAPDVRLYTEMVVAQAVMHGDRGKLLGFEPVEHPLALQLGGSDPAMLASASALAEEWGYDEINLNVGCPSDRVQSGSFGACLMLQPDIVVACLDAMQAVTRVPVSIKTRIGVDDKDDYGFLRDFIGRLSDAGCEMFIVHARKAILQGLSPKENRSIPPLNYETVYRLKRDFPELRIVINGGVRESAAVGIHLQHTDGVMIGRQAYSHPWWIAQLQGQLLAASDSASGEPNRADIVHAMAAYADRQLTAGVRLNHITRHMLGLYTGEPGARAWRRFLTEEARLPDAGAEVLLNSLRELG